MQAELGCQTNLNPSKKLSFRKPSCDKFRKPLKQPCHFKSMVANLSTIFMDLAFSFRKGPSKTTCKYPAAMSASVSPISLIILMWGRSKANYKDSFWISFSIMQEGYSNKPVPLQFPSSALCILVSLAHKRYIMESDAWWGVFCVHIPVLSSVPGDPLPFAICFSLVWLSFPFELPVH